MKDSEIRGIILQAFYDLRNEHNIGINVTGLICVRIPHPINIIEALRACAQLAERDLIEWDPVENHEGRPVGGCGHITSYGSDVIEGEVEAPLGIQIDNSHNVQHVNVTATNVSGVQVGGANSLLHQRVTQHIEQIIDAIETSPASPEQKQEAKSRLRRFLESEVAANLFGAGVKALIERLTE